MARVEVRVVSIHTHLACPLIIIVILRRPATIILLVARAILFIVQVSGAEIVAIHSISISHTLVAPCVAERCLRGYLQVLTCLIDGTLLESVTAIFVYSLALSRICLIVRKSFLDSIPSVFEARPGATIGENFTSVGHDNVALLQLIFHKIHSHFNLREGHFFVLNDEGRHLPLLGFKIILYFLF